MDDALTNYFQHLPDKSVVLMNQNDEKTYFDLHQYIAKISIDIRSLGCCDSPQWRE